jgi:hypothetical protein
MKEMGGFRLFYNTQRHEIDFPKGPVSNKRAFASDELSDAAARRDSSQPTW